MPGVTHHQHLPEDPRRRGTDRSPPLPAEPGSGRQPGNPTIHGTSRVLRAAMALTFAAAACGNEAAPTTDADATTSTGYAALAANFDLAAGSPQAFLVGLIGPGQESIAYGTIQVAFSFSGPVGNPLAAPRPGATATAAFEKVSGTQDDPATSRPQAVDPVQATGVYATEPITFPDAGYWEVTTTFDINGTTQRATAAFEVLAEHQMPNIGDRALPTVNPIAGDPNVPAVAIDSRAADGVPIPDPQLHTTRIADALTARRPLTVVITTPSFCESRFCGPITDAVDAVAARHSDRMAFVHLEVWQDIQTQTINTAAAEWILRNGADGNEPWVFIIDADGIIADRFDNVANEALIEAAVQRVLA